MKNILAENKGAIKPCLLLPVIIGILFLLAGSLFIIGKLQHENLNDEVTRRTEHVLTLLDSEVEHEAKELRGLIKILKRDKTLRQLWLKKDRQAILDYARPVLEEMASKQEITHYYFHDIDHVCFLRIHNPDRYGDRINRFTTNNAFRENEPVWGIELGSYGTFTLRVVEPWYIDGKISGYLELGREIEHIATRLSNMLDTKLFFFIHKKYLDRSRWEEGMAMLGRKADWDQFSHFVVVNNTSETFPKTLETSLYSLKECLPEEYRGRLINVSFGKKEFRGKMTCLTDAGGQNIGDILSLTNINSQQAAIHRLFNIMAGAYGVMFLILFTAFFFYFREIKEKLSTAYNRLNQEIDKHRETKVKAEEATRLKGEFLSNVSHEIRTPMNSIIGFSELLSQEGSLSAELTDYVHAIFNNSHLLLNLINDILDISKIEAGNLEINFCDFDVRSLQKDLDSLLRPETDKKELAFTIHFAEDFPKTIRTDPFRLQQCLVNLTSNAIKFTHQGIIGIHCYAEDILDKQYVRLEVRDTGVGIPESKLESIFDAFTQADGSNSRKFGGTGLGLTITRKVVTMLGGELFVNSKVDQGSVFGIQLPVNPSEKTDNEKSNIQMETCEPVLE